MMIKCQKCGFENQMGSIFCRECGEKLDMDAIDPNKLQKDVNKEKSIKLAKKRIRGLISGLISLLVVAAFIFVVIHVRKDPPYVLGDAAAAAPAEGEAAEGENTDGAVVVSEEESKALSRYNDACNGASGNRRLTKETYTYPEINLMIKKKLIEPLAAESQGYSAKITAFELDFDADKNRSLIYIWFDIADKIHMLYTVHCNLIFTPRDPENKEIDKYVPIQVEVKRLDIGLLPLFISTKPFLKQFSNSLLVDAEGKANEVVQKFFMNAQGVEFHGEGVNIEFRGAPPSDDSGDNAAPPPQKSPSSSGNPLGKSIDRAAQSNEKHNNDVSTALKNSGSTKSAKSSKKSEEDAAKKAAEEERKRKAEEYRQQQKEKEEERKRKKEEEAQRKKEEQEERKRRQQEENERIRQENEERRRNRNNNDYNSRSSRNSRNRGW